MGEWRRTWRRARHTNAVATTGAERHESKWMTSSDILLLETIRIEPKAKNDSYNEESRAGPSFVYFWGSGKFSSEECNAENKLIATV